MRINRYISSTGYCSRRAADHLVEAGDVMINGELATLGAKVKPGDRVTIRGQILAPPSENQRVYLLLNKPPGITCTSRRDVPGNIMDFIDYPTRVFTVGRLDRDSRGLILLTNDGMIANRIIRARYGHEKEYEVTCDRDISDDMIRKMRTGVPILNTVTQPCKAWKTSTRTFRIVLTQGLNRQIRRMCGALNYKVLDLCRVRIMNLSIEGIKEGMWRKLTNDELTELHRLVCAKEDHE